MFQPVACLARSCLPILICLLNKHLMCCCLASGQATVWENPDIVWFWQEADRIIPNPSSGSAVQRGTSLSSLACHGKLYCVKTKSRACSVLILTQGILSLQTQPPWAVSRLPFQQWQGSLHWCPVSLAPSDAPAHSATTGNIGHIKQIKFFYGE